MRAHQPTYRLFHEDAVTWLRTLPDASVDLIVTDPAYESLEKHRAVGTTTRLKHSKASSNDWFTIFPNARFPELFAELYRVLAKDSHFYLFCDQETAFVAKPIGEQAGFKFWKPLVWDKCLAPDTPVYTARGVVPIGEIGVGDRVACPEGDFTPVRATRRTRREAVRLALSDGSSIVASVDHRFCLSDGSLREAGALSPGTRLMTRRVRDASERRITSVEPAGEVDLVDISIEHADELFVLGNGVVTHNCKIGMGYHYRSRYELILFFEKGKRKLRDLSIADVITSPRIHKGYPTEKPVAVSEVLIGQSADPGAIVIDPFVGSGSTGVAAAKHGCHFWGSDVCAEAIHVARARLEEAGGIEDERAIEGKRTGQLGLVLE